MLISDNPPVHLTYCLNIHPGEALCDVESALDAAAQVRAVVAPGKPFGAGLRLGIEAVRALAGPARTAFRQGIEARGLYVFTLNGFPYGPFHGRPVKAEVYAPDWRTPERLAYTRELAEILADLLPPDMEGSISTVPGSYAPWIRTDTDRATIVDGLLAAVAALRDTRARRGRVIRLGLEPEPGCLFETVHDVRTWYENELLPRRTAWNRDRPGGAALSEADVREHLGVCLDTCHAAVMGEPVEAGLAGLRADGIRVVKVQLSAAPRAPNTEEARRALEAFADPVYLHPLSAECPDGRRRAWSDLGPALRALPGLPAGMPCTTHVHVPLDWPGDTVLSSTRSDIDDAAWSALRDGGCPHLEIETYTFTVLPPALRRGGIVPGIAGEFGWVLRQFRGAGGSGF